MSLFDEIKKLYKSGREIQDKQRDIKEFHSIISCLECDAVTAQLPEKPEVDEEGAYLENITFSSLKMCKKHQSEYDKEKNTTIYSDPYIVYKPKPLYCDKCDEWMRRPNECKCGNIEREEYERPGNFIQGFGEKK